MYKYLIVLMIAFAVIDSAHARALPDDFILPARAAVEGAVAGGAEQHAPLELRFAREKLLAAEAANGSGDGKLAGRLARQAEVDAELCVAKIGAALAREATRRQRQANEELQADLAGDSR